MEYGFFYCVFYMECPLREVPLYGIHKYYTATWPISGWSMSHLILCNNIHTSKRTLTQWRLYRGILCIDYIFCCNSNRLIVTDFRFSEVIVIIVIGCQLIL